MTPKEKAEDLFHIYNKKGLNQISSIINRSIRKKIIKQCSEIVVDEIVKNIPIDNIEKELGYWEKVKEELEKL